MIVGVVVVVVAVLAAVAVVAVESSCVPPEAALVVVVQIVAPWTGHRSHQRVLLPVPPRIRLVLTQISELGKHDPLRPIISEIVFLINLFLLTSYQE